MQRWFKKFYDWALNSMDELAVKAEERRLLRYAHVPTLGKPVVKQPPLKKSSAATIEWWNQYAQEVGMMIAVYRCPDQSDHEVADVVQMTEAVLVLD